MAHYAVTVCLPPEAGTDLDAALAAALAPFGADTDLEWEFGFLWDNWRIKGGSDGLGFWIRAGYTDGRRLIHDGPDPRNGAPRLSSPGMCAVGPRGLLDLSEEPEPPRALAVEAWELWHRLAEEYPPALPEVLKTADPMILCLDQRGSAHEGAEISWTGPTPLRRAGTGDSGGGTRGLRERPRPRCQRRS